jgi:hypothetical protein
MPHGERGLLDDLNGTHPQAVIAEDYAEIILSGEEVDWPNINAAIIKRWSLSGLRRVKAMAWRQVKQARKAP